MDEFSEKLRFTLEQSWSLLSRVEQNMLTNSKKLNLSISELHLIEVVNRNPIAGRTVSEIAKDLMVTKSSVTIAVNKLEKKGYVIRKRSIEDGRVVYIKLTDEGLRADRIHKRFHKSLAISISKGMNENEKGILLSCIERMNIFLDKRVKKMEEVKIKRLVS